MHLEDILNTVEIQMLLRVVVALILGALIGLEREMTSKWAGLRTHILVCLGAAIFTVLSIYAFPLPASPFRYGDPARVAAQIVTGIGFIGAGTVFRHGPTVYGLTTAATLWISASIGMAVGTGSYKLAVFATLLTVFTLIQARKLEKLIIRKHQTRFARITANLSCKTEYTEDIINELDSLFNSITRISKKEYEKADGIMKINVTFEECSTNPVKTAFDKINNIKNVKSSTIQQMFDEA